MRGDKLTYPNVEFTRKESLWNSGGVQGCANNIQNGHENEPAKGAHIESLVAAKDDTVVNGWYDAAEA